MSPTGIRARVGVRQLTMAELINPIAAAGLVIQRIREDADRAVPRFLALRAVRPD
ncbi:MAG: hypothetical protein ACR2F6_14290 [Mycobacteriales bacterium]